MSASEEGDSSRVEEPGVMSIVIEPDTETGDTGDSLSDRDEVPLHPPVHDHDTQHMGYAQQVQDSHMMIPGSRRDQDEPVQYQDIPEHSPEDPSGEVVVSSQGDLLSTQVLQEGAEGGMESAICLVCSDRGSGYHYSVYSCEGCKGFFKRTVQKNLQYTCKENQNCVINKYTRNSCQYCRFQKCMAVGMKREAVREDRTPGGKHRTKRPRQDEGAGPGGSRIRLVYPEEPMDDDLLQKLIDAKPDLIPARLGTETVPANQLDINELMQYGYIEVRYIIEWARKVPGFSELAIEDQMALLKASFMDLNVFRLAYRSQNFPGSVKFAEGVMLTIEESVNIGWGQDLIKCTLEFTQRLKDIILDRTEFCILNAVVLTYPDAVGIQDKTEVTMLQSRILDCLRKHDIRKYPEDPRRYGKLLLRLPALRTVSAKAAERFLSMSLDGSIKMNALVLEIMS